MINSIIEAVSISLNEEFGDGHAVHMEEIMQDLETPCFFIQCLNPACELFSGRRYFRSNQFCIQYFPESSEIQRESNDVAERMMQCLEYITIRGEDRPVRGTKMKYEIIDGVLNFFVNYDFFICKTGQQTCMESLESDTDVKGGD